MFVLTTAGLEELRTILGVANPLPVIAKSYGFSLESSLTIEIVAFLVPTAEGSNVT